MLFISINRDKLEFEERLIFNTDKTHRKLTDKEGLKKSVYALFLTVLKSLLRT